MTNVYVEPRPKCRPEGSKIDDYVLEHANDGHVAGAQPSYSTQALAVADAKRLGHQPLIAACATPARAIRITGEPHDRGW